MMKKPWTAILLAAILLLSSGCGSSPAGSSQGDASSGGSTAAANAVSADEIDMEFSSRDLDVGYDESTAVKITLSGERKGPARSERRVHFLRGPRGAVHPLGR